MSLLSVAEAQARLFAAAPRVAVETCALSAAAGRWLAAPLIARRDQPSADLSAMDGYVLRFADLSGPLGVIGESAAGRPFAGTVGAGEAVRIFTGAIVPAGADTILVQEEAARAGDQLHLAGEGPGAAGRHIRRRGQDFAHGAELLPAGARLSPAAIGLAAAAGHGALAVHRRVRVAIAATGDELVPPGAPVNDGQLPEANGAMLAALIADLPADVTPLGILPDRLEALTAAFAATEADIVVTIGGASVGDHDLVRPALEAAGGTIDFWRIAMRPGKPLLAGRLGDAVVLGLPGNPVSAFVTASLFLRPLVAAMAGAGDPLPRRRRVTLAAPLPANDAREDYLRGWWQDGGVVAASRQDSAMLATLARATCLIVRPPHAPAAKPGDSVEILDLA
ncbi:MAG: molybdopterin molybdenumtransferase MoeA [Proteobacteria bacterium SG_bin6]|nr:MAG: molybdopterin molybdenumtransferase MoeA [Proteobacteria bacterium SG_bin6]